MKNNNRARVVSYSRVSSGGDVSNISQDFCMNIDSDYAKHRSRICSEKVKEAWKLRKERLAKLKTPASTSVSKTTK